MDKQVDVFGTRSAEDSHAIVTISKSCLIEVEGMQNICLINGTSGKKVASYEFWKM
jgi:hypothetical protein